MNRMNHHFYTSALALLSLAHATLSPAQTLTTLVNFDGTNGDTPEYSSLAKGSDGNFYGVTYQGGANNLGTIFKVTPGGALTTIYNFASSTLWSSQPTSTLLLANDGNFYGTTTDGGVCDCGILFLVTPGGAMTVVYEFATTNGAFDSNAPTSPIGGVIQGTDGYLYGTASYGGAHASGAIYRVSLSGVESVIHSFSVTQSGTAGAAGWQPVGRLIQGSDGNLYGVTASGGFNGGGSIFSISPNGQNFTTLHSFNVTDGWFIDAGLVQGSDGNFYGTAPNGGANYNGVVYKMTPSGTFTILHTYSASGSEGSAPDYTELIQATDGNLYGATKKGGMYGYGTIFKITTAGQLTVLYNFNVTDGQSPVGGLVQGADGNLYGTTSGGGSNFRGTVFKLSLPGGTTPPGGAAPAITSVVNDAGFKAGGPITSGSWVALFGTNLAPAGDSRQWNASTEIVNGKFPTSLDGTSVTVNGKAAAVGYISPTQLNIQPPDDTAVGPVQITVTTKAGGASTPFTANYAQFAPGLFPATTPYIAAQHVDNSYVGGYGGATPAKPGEVIVLWGTGFGPASPPVAAGQVFSGASKLANPVTITIGGQPAAVDFAGVVGAGLVQINVHVPNSINNGDAPVVVTVGGVSTQTTGNMIAVHN